MSIAHVVGVDPGLVHTGVVGLDFVADDRHVDVAWLLVDGLDPVPVRDWPGLAGAVVFVEKYQPRHHLSSDKRMVQGEAGYRREMPHARVIGNGGAVRLVTKPLMEMLGVWDFPVRTHHQDLRSAARIALLGMMKDEGMNRVLSDVVRDHLRGDGWSVCRA
jgi:hypothetical protein